MLVPAGRLGERGRPGLWDRDAELARVDGALAAARAGVGVALLIEGPAGIGKTAILDEARAWARAAGMSVLSGRGTELEREYALGVARQCLLPPVRSADEDQRRRLLAGAAARAAPLVLDGVAGATSDPFAMLHALYWLVTNMTLAEPVLLVVDDAQWADEPSLRFLAFLVRRVQSSALAVLVACRLDDELPVPDALVQLRTDPVVEVLAPRPLGAGAVAAFLSMGGGEVAEEFALACQIATGGNPFLLGHLLGALVAQGIPFSAGAARDVAFVTPPEVARTVGVQLAGMPSDALALARAVAVLGDDTALDEAAGLAELDRGAAVEAAERLAIAGLLDGGRPLRFRHPLLRGAVMASMTAGERDDRHRRAAALLAERDEPVERQATHLLAAEPAACADVVAALRLAARRARGRGSPAPAVTLLERALAEPPPVEVRYDVLLELGYCEHAIGRLQHACERAVQAHRLASGPTERAQALKLWGSAVGVDLDSIAAFGPLVRDVLAELPASERELSLELKAQALQALFGAPDGDLNAALATEAHDLDGATPGEAKMLGIYILRRVLQDVTADEIAGHARRAARHAGALMSAGADTLAFTGVALGLHWADELDAEERLVAEALALSQAHGSAPGFAIASTLMAQLRRRRGLLHEAEADARAGVAAGEGWASMMASGALAASLLDQGRNGEAWEALDSAGLTAQIGIAPPLTELLLTRMRVRVGTGDHAAALRDWHDAVQRPIQGVPKASWIENYVSAAHALRATGDLDGARALAQEAVEIARRWGTPGAIGEALRGLARMQDDVAAVELLEDAIAHLGRSPARLLRARALLDLGAVLRRSGQRVASREPLREALDIAHSCAAQTLAEAARQELAASGIRVSARDAAGSELLTASERRIAKLAAAGASNAEIAQALFVTIKTVEMHLTRCYRKLDIGGRGELAAALATR